MVNSVLIKYYIIQDASPHDEHLSSGPNPKLCSDQYIFQFLFKTI